VRNRIRELRDAHGWTQAHLARELNVSRQTVNALEAGRWDPSLGLAFAIAALFDQTVEAVFDPDPATRRDGNSAGA
jgi:putative transcriptional regulator